LVAVLVNRKNKRRILRDDTVFAKVKSNAKRMTSELIHDVSLERVVEVRMRSSRCYSLVDEFPDIVRSELLGNGMEGVSNLIVKIRSRSALQG
jgi:pantoate kinase